MTPTSALRIAFRAAGRLAVDRGDRDTGAALIHDAWQQAEAERAAAVAWLERVFCRRCPGVIGSSSNGCTCQAGTRGAA